MAGLTNSVLGISSNISHLLLDTHYVAPVFDSKPFYDWDYDSKGNPLVSRAPRILIFSKYVYSYLPTFILRVTNFSMTPIK